MNAKNAEITNYGSMRIFDEVMINQSMGHLSTPVYQIWKKKQYANCIYVFSC